MKNAWIKIHCNTHPLGGRNRKELKENKKRKPISQALDEPETERWTKDMFN